MSRLLLILNNAADRARAVHLIGHAPPGTRLEFKQIKRTLDQNARMWAMLTDVATQVPWGWEGEKLSTDDWKDIFMQGLKRELRTAPNLDRRGVVALGRSTSDLSKEEMSDLLGLIAAFGAKHDVIFYEPQEEVSAARV